MRDNMLAGHKNRPFITLYAESRGKSVPLPGKYDEELQIVVFDKEGKKAPLIRVCSYPETFTKTEADRESDESSSVLLETQTKTAAGRESDDADIKHPPELMTKTFVERESDDDRLFFLELQTKTKIEREGDDNLFGL
ncbi:MAG: hypothetical protein M1497_00785 [Nitrospirae bacterium]|nr:hypothetical protein [Nitrospirota bacterium]MCL5021905.1 hypothetical protein [Nitrospirota bacterium]